MADAHPPEPDLRCLSCGQPVGDRDRCPNCGWSYAAGPDDETTEPPATASATAAPADPGPPPTVPQPAAPPPLGWEMAAVLAVGVVSNVASAAAYAYRPTPPLPFVVESVEGIALGACTAVATLYVMRVGGPAGPGWGLTRPRLRDAIFALIPFFAAVFTWWASSALPIPAEGPLPSRPASPVGPAQWVLLVVRFVVAAYAEELVTRAYLVTRLTTVFRSRAGAVVGAAACFAAYHLHLGLEGVIEAFLRGLAYGGVYLVLPRVWPLAFGHAGFYVLREYLAAD